MEGKDGSSPGVSMHETGLHMVTIIFRTGGVTNVTDGSQIDTLATVDDLIVTREATLVSTGTGSVVRAAEASETTLNGRCSRPGRSFAPAAAS